MPSFSKCKRTRRDMRCVLFPEDVRRGTCETQKAVKSSWERCGDSFLGTPMIKKQKAVKCSNRAVKLQAQTSKSVSPNAEDKDLVHIAWTSSEDEQSDDKQPLRLSSSAVIMSTQRSRAAVSASGRYTRFLSTGADTDELLTIDSESGHEDFPSTSKPVSQVTIEIQDYSSHSDEDPNHSQPNRPAEQRLRSVSEWVRSAHVLLQTPPKQTQKVLKTPEDSGKKKRKFKSGGLAERLNRLHCRQRSAISFWRHQPVSGIIGTEERPGVLVVYVQNVWEVCGLQVALCQRRPMRETCIVLFSRETATQLAPGTGDTIYVYPPWQSLTVDGERHPIILNTHFSQKVLGDKKQDSGGTSLMTPYALTRCLWKREENLISSQASIHPIIKTNRDVGSVYVSILEALDSCGTMGYVYGSVEVVVQRTYFYTFTDFSRTSLLGHQAISRSLSGTTQQYISRCCLLVQDVYGMFSEVEMQHTSLKDNLKEFAENLQGKVCLLQGLKVIQRLTRERCAQLFSLIDSLWPPVVPLRVPGEVSCYQTGQAAAPSFCYRLAGQQDCVLIKHESPLYRPAFVQTLRKILQDGPTRRLCSFRGVVVHKKQKDKEKDLLLFVTDSSLQDEQSSEIISRTLPVYVTSTLLLQTSVCQAITALSPQFRPMLVFKDTLIEQGTIIITRQSVIELDSKNQNTPSLQSVLLDQLTPQSPSCSLCTVTGMVMNVDESSAFSWPSCSHCGGDSLETLKDRQDVFFCVSCGVVDKPSKKMHLEVFLSCPSVCHWTVKVKLQQKSIMSLLNSAGLTEVYQVEAVLGKSIGPLDAFINVVTRGSTALWMALEEITL